METAAAPAAAPAASGDRGGRILSAAPLPSRPGLTWGGGRREAGSPPGSNMAPRAADPIAGAVTPRALGGLGAGKCWGRAPSGRSAGQCSGPGSSRRPAAAATSGRALAAASPLPAARPPRQARQARPSRELTGGGVGAEVTHTLGPGPPRNRESF